MPRRTVVTMPGDGIGKVTLEESLRVLEAVGFEADYVHADIGWDYWVNEGNPLPQRTIDLLREHGLGLFGAITSKPKWEADEELIPELMAKTGATAVSWNNASTPLGRRRDRKVFDAISRAGGQAIQFDDHTVFAADEITTKTGGNYQVYTPYRNEWWRTWELEPRFSSSRARYPKTPIPKVAIIVQNAKMTASHFCFSPRSR